MGGQAGSGDGIGLWLLGALLYAYPDAFRRDYGDPLLQTMRDGLRETRSESRWKHFVFWRRAARNIALGGLRMRLRSAVGRNDSPQPTNQPGGSGGWTKRQLDILQTDLTQAFRLLLRSPVMTVATILMLAVAVGLTTLTFSVVYAVTIRDLPYSDVHRIVDINYWGERVDGRGGRARSSFPFEALGDVSQTFAAIGQFHEQQVPFGDGTSINLVPGAEMSPDMFELLGVAPQIGRTFTPEDTIPGAPATVILGHELWISTFDGHPDALGQIVRVGGTPHTVIGVMPEGFGFSYYARLWLPHGRQGDFGAESFGGGVVARLREEVTIEQANIQLEMRRLRLRGSGIRPFEDASENWRFFLQARPLGWERWEELGWWPYMALVPVALALLVACANVAGLLLARGVSRRREMTLRAVLGSNRSRLARQLLTESIVTAFGAGALGLLLVNWSIPLVRSIAQRAFDEAFPFGIASTGIDSVFPMWLQLTPDRNVALFTLAASALVVTVIGLVPVRQGSQPDMGAALRAGGYGTTAGRQSKRWLKTLSVTQIALSTVLVVGASLTLQMSEILQSFDPGIDVDQVLELRLGPDYSRIAAVRDDTRLADLKLRALQRFAAHPDVESASSVWYADPDAVARVSRLNEDSFVGVAAPATLQEQRGIFGRAIGSNHFRTLGLQVLRGRGINERDGRTAQRVAVVSESTARIGWPDEDPLGRQIQLVPDGPGYTVVGIVEDRARSDALRGRSRLTSWHHIYVPAQQLGMAPDYLLVRSRIDPVELAEPLRRIAYELDPALPLTIRRPASRDNAVVMAPMFRWGTRVLSTIGVSALVLAAIGIFSVISYAAVQRTREMGLRSALGADRSDIVRLLLRDALWLAVVGLLVGTGGAAMLGRALEGILFGVPPFSPLPYVGVVTAVVLIATFAGWQPARRAARVDPAVALRED